MELRQNIRRATTRPMAWTAALLIALALGLMGWYMHPSSAPTHKTSVVSALATTVESPRNGGPGGQFGDAPQPNQTSRVGGPGGQFGDAP
jgi:hypothetical protein